MSLFYVGVDFPNSRTNSFEVEKGDKDHGVPNVPTRLITRSKAMKIQPTFFLHLQNWIGSVQLLFHVLQVDLIEEGSFGSSEVNICTDEAADEVTIYLNSIISCSLQKGEKLFVKVSITFLHRDLMGSGSKLPIMITTSLVGI